MLVREQRNKAKRGEKAEALDQRRGVHSSVFTPPKKNSIILVFFYLPVILGLNSSLSLAKF